MKRFDYSAVKARLVERMKMNSESATILDDGAFSNLLDVFAEGISEVSRYLEYALLEKKWTTAQNISSLTTMADLIGRRRSRPKSAIGYIIVSHTDAEGVERLSNYGSTFFELDEPSDYDNMTKSEDSNYIERSALVPWTNKNIYEIPKGTIFTASNGTQYISTKTVKSRILTKAYSAISSNETRLTEFLSAGGWDGIKYVKVPVIQGIQKYIELGTTNGTRFQSFSFDASGVEDASNSISRDFFYVEVLPPGATEPETWVEVNRIRMAQPYDKVYEAKLSDDGTQIIIKFGDGISGKLPTQNSTVTVHYLETKGSSGNIEQKFQISEMAFPNGQLMIDPRNNAISNFLSCTNITPIMGGKDIEDEDDFKTNAPVSYLSSYTTAVKSAYEKQILNNSPVSLAKLVCYPSSSFKASQIDTDIDENINEEVANELNIISNALNISAIKANGDMVTDDESEDFIQTIIKTLGDIKGPNDSLNYIEPNFIKVAPSIKINTYDIDTSESEIQSTIEAAVASEYSVFNTEFKTPLHESKISHVSSLFSFTDSVNVMLEALADVSFDKDDIKVMTLSYTDTDSSSTVEEPVVAIPFSFDKVYASNQYELGFKNCSVESPYLLKVDLTFNGTSSADTRNRTFFLYDNRTSDNTSIQEAIKIDNNNADFKKLSATLKQAEANIGEDITYYDETRSNYDKRSIRVAQFPYISEITDDTFMGKAKSYSTAPFENRPYEIDTDGSNRVFTSNNVDGDDRVSFDGTSGSTATSCYKRNWDYIDFVDIIFHENYDDPDSTEYATGYFVIPVSHFNFSNLPTFDSSNPSDSSYVRYLSEFLKNYVTLKVYAKPKQTDIEPTNDNDICFVDDDDIKVEKVLKYKN